MSNSFCTKCGAPLAPEASFCVLCGSRVKTVPQSQPVYSAPQPQPVYNAAPQYVYRQPRGRLSRRAIAGMAAAGAVVVAGIILLIVLLGGGGDASIKADDICGEWRGSVRIENVNTNIDGLDDYVDPEVVKKQAGTEQDMRLYIELDDDGDVIVSGNIFYNVDAEYKNGVLTMKQKQGTGVKLSFQGGVNKKGESYVIRGTWRATCENREFASGSWAAEMD